MAWLLRASEHPEARMLVIRRNADDLADWVDRAHKMYPYAKITGKPATIRFPSGAVIRTNRRVNSDTDRRQLFEIDIKL